MAFLNKGLTIELTDERVAPAIVDEVVATTPTPRRQAETEPRPPQKVSAAVPLRGRHRDFVKHINATKSAIHRASSRFEAEDKRTSAEIAMQWNHGYSESVHTFANTINTTRVAPTRRASARRSPR
jgi:DNA gyrase subunit B